MNAKMTLCLAAICMALCTSSTKASYTATETNGGEENVSKAWTDCDDGPGQYRKWKFTNGECGAQTLLTWTYLDDDAEQPYFSIDTYYRKTWTSDGSGTSCYRFDYEITGRAYSYAALSVDPPPCDTGFGEAVTKGKVKVEAGTANGGDKEEQKIYWTGAKCLEGNGGLTGIGIGADSASISWTNPDPQDWDPSETKDENASVTGSKDDPGSSCFIKISTEAASQASEDEGYYSSSHGVGTPHTPWSADVVLK